MNTETIRKMSRSELEDQMATLELRVEPGDTDDELRCFIVEELARLGDAADRADQQEDAANEAYYGGDSPGSYGPDDPGAFGGR